MWRSCDCVSGGGNLCLKICQIRGQHGVDFVGIAEGGVIGGCWDIKAYYNELTRYDRLVCGVYIHCQRGIMRHRISRVFACVHISMAESIGCFMAQK